jgi:ribosomal protein S6
MVLLRPDFPMDDKKKRTDLIGRLVKGAAIKDVAVVGKKFLAFPIKKQTEGVYIVAHIEADTIKMSSIDAEAKSGTDIIRFLLIQKEG